MMTIAADFVLKKLAGKIIDQGSSFLFSEMLSEYGEENGLSQDEQKYIRRVVNLVVQFETAYRYHIINNSSRNLDGFKQDMTSLGQEAAELAVVGELRGYGNQEIEALDRATLTAQFFETHIPEVDDVLGISEDSDDIAEQMQKVTISEFYGETEAPRDLIATIAKSTPEK